MNKPLIIATTALGSVLGDYFIKRYSIHPCWQYVLGVAVFYGIGVFFFAKMVLAFDNLARASSIWTFVYTVMMLFVSQVVFHEHLTRQQWAGIIIGSTAVVLLL